MDESGQQLLSWLQAEGAVVAPQIAVAIVPPLGRELLATGATSAGEELIRLPPELCLPAPPAAGGAEDLPEDVRLAAAVLEAESEPKWDAYRATLPTEDDLANLLPIFWKQERLEELADRLPSLQEEVRERQQLLRGAAARLEVSVDLLTRAHALVSTRAVGACINACALIPGVDLANHSPEPNAELVVAGQPGLQTGRATVTDHGAVWEHGTAGILALRDLAPGEAVRISYGKYPNQVLLLDYGFDLGAANPAGDREVAERKKG